MKLPLIWSENAHFYWERDAQLIKFEPLNLELDNLQKEPSKYRKAASCAE